MNLPKRKERPRLGVKEPQREYPAHRAWVRLHGCIVPGCDRLPIECAHIRKGVPADEAGGVGIKPHDRWCVSMCGGPGGHHAEQHTLGEKTFASKYGLDLVALAREFARQSPHRAKWEASE